MSKTMIEDLKHYFANTPKEQILEDWEKTKEWDNVRPTVEDYNKTAVDWLLEQVNNKGWGGYMISIPVEIIKQAKAMEKKQIIEALEYGESDWGHLDGEKYYNETYNNKTK